MTAEDFTSTLRRLVDPALVCYFNPMKERFVIDRCTHPESSSGLHTCDFRCLKTNVMIVETPDGQFRELGDDLIGALHAMDTWEKFGTVEKFSAAEKAMEDADAASRQAGIDDAWNHLAKEDEGTARQAFHLIQQHNTAEIH